MIRFLETTLRKNFRAVVNNVNHFAGRSTSSSQEPALKQLDLDSRHDNRSNSEEQQEQQDRSDYSRCHRWRPECIAGHPSILMGTVLAAGFQLSKIAADVWSNFDNDNYRKSSIFAQILAPVAFTRSVTFMRNESKTKFKVVSNRKNEETKATSIVECSNFERSLLASDSETCVMMNRKGAAFAEIGDWKNAVRWFSSAANSGHAPAQFNLAVYYHTVSVDMEQARLMYTKAAEQGHKEAAYNLSIILAQLQSPGWQTPMLQAAELGLNVAQNFLARYFFDNKNYSKSRLYYNMLRGNDATMDDCSYWIGRCHEAEGNLLLADLWYRQAALGNGEHKLDASARSAKLGVGHVPRLMTESASATLLMEKAKVDSTHRSIYHESSSKPVFFIPSSEKEIDFENSRIDSFPLSSGSKISRNGNIRRSHSAVQCSS